MCKKLKIIMIIKSIIEKLRGVKVVGEKLFSILMEFHLSCWSGRSMVSEYRYLLVLPQDLVSIAVKAILSGEFEFPEDHQLVSALQLCNLSF